MEGGDRPTKKGKPRSADCPQRNDMRHGSTCGKMWSQGAELLDRRACKISCYVVSYQKHLKSPRRMRESKKASTLQGMHHESEFSLSLSYKSDLKIDEILDQLGNSRYFTTLDLASGYHQVLVDEQDKEKTAFSTDKGH
ncbi:Retrovirus-related Pol polyprotein from transposon 297 [Eumeta japonica]|uniref:Retrovirus-related Pol polyprotein from transposon 297 n=1 Tax=Eumeta variegata TaxID=151549 RepID=A0A4C1SET9_EUMVA|nr:Retrovirus-related Pol polyprotein from transposon 297 [Eumeta japonica]